MGADRDKRRVKFSCSFFGEQILNPMIEHDLHPHLLNPVNLLHQHAARQSIGRDAEMHHATRKRTSLVNLHSVAKAAQMVCCREAARTRTDDKYRSEEHTSELQS